MDKIEVGDAVIINDNRSTVGELVFQEYWPGDGYIVEFIDSLGNYRSWHQSIDGGQLIKGVSNHE